MNLFKSLLFCFLAFQAYGQKTDGLSKLLWNEVENCYSMLEDIDEDGKIDIDELVDDSKNGYLKLSGSWPTCGCSCTNTVGAYKGADGKYTLLKKEEWGCSWKHQITSNKSLADVLPEDFGAHSFMTENRVFETEFAHFYLDIDIPQVGTATKVSIKLIPFGISAKSDDVMTTHYSEESSPTRKVLYRFGELAQKIEEDSTLESIAGGEFDKLSVKDLQWVDALIGEDYGAFLSREALAKELSELKKIYEIYSSIAHEFLILSWNREKNRFQIKENGGAPESMTFQKFLQSNEFWGPVC